MTLILASMFDEIWALRKLSLPEKISSMLPAKYDLCLTFAVRFPLTVLVLLVPVLPVLVLLLALAVLSELPILALLAVVELDPVSRALAPVVLATQRATPPSVLFDPENPDIPNGEPKNDVMPSPPSSRLLSTL